MVLHRVPATGANNQSKRQIRIQICFSTLHLDYTTNDAISHRTITRGELPNNPDTSVHRFFGFHSWLWVRNKRINNVLTG